MISMKLMLRGINQNVGPVRNILIPRLTTPFEDKENVLQNNHELTISSRNLSTSGYKSQAAPILTPKTPKMSNFSEAHLPQKPKKPMTPWIAFLRDSKDRYLKDRPMRASELTVALAKEWQTTDKSRYEQEYRKRHEEYNRAIDSYENSLTEEQRAVIKMKKNLKRESKAMKVLRGTKPPVLPRNPANMYCIERCQDSDIKEQMKMKRSALVLKDIFAEYRNLSDSDKDKYVELQQKDRLRFQQEFNQWYEGIMSDSSLSKTVHEKAGMLHARFKALNWI